MNLKKLTIIQVMLSILLSTQTVIGAGGASQDSDVSKGYACLNKGDADEAKECFNNALKVNPKNADAYVGLASLNPFGQASIDYCTKAISLNPNLTEAYSVRANAYLGKKQYQKANDDYTKAIALRPKTMTNESISNQYVLRGDTFEQLGQHEKAIADFSTALKTASKSKEKCWALQKRGWAFAAQKNYKAAIADFDSTLIMNHKHSGFYSNRAGVQLQFQRYPEAIADYTKAIELAPNDAFSYGQRAKAYSALGKKELAEKDEQHAFKLGLKKTGDMFSTSIVETNTKKQQ